MNPASRDKALRPALLAVSVSLSLAACDGQEPVKVAPTAKATARAAQKPPEAAGIRFISRITGGAAETDALPLVIAMHGLGSKPEELVGLYAQLGAPARLVLPYGFDAYLGGFTWFEPGSLRDPDKLAAGSRAAADRLSAMIDEISKRFPTRGKAIVTGFSQGAILSYSLAVTHPEIVRAAFPVSGIMPEKLSPSDWPAGRDKPKIHAFHGTSDERIGIEGDRASVRRLRDLGLSAEITDYPGIGHTITPEMRRDLLKAIGDTARE